MNNTMILNEIGLLEMYRNIERFRDNENIIRDMRHFLPIPDVFDADEKINQITGYLMSLEKPKLFFLMPEIAVFEKLLEAGWGGTTLVVLPSNIDEEAEDRVQGNMPHGLSVEFIKEGFFPQDFTVSNGAIIAFGFCTNDYGIILKTNQRMMALYKGFYGEKVLVSCFPGGVQERPPNWTAINNANYFSEVFDVI